MLFQPGRYKEDRSGDGNLQGQIDLERVRYAKRAFRRRYASRTNLDKLFGQYDKDNKGFVDARDLHEQAGKIGMGLSLDEA